MPDGDAEKKKLADLYFNVDTENLKSVNTILDNIDAKVAQMNQKKLNIKFDVDASSLNSMSSNVNKAFSQIESDGKSTSGNITKTVNDLSNTVEKQLRDRVSSNKSANSEILSNTKTVNTNLEKAAIDIARVRINQETKTTEAIKRENAKQLSSHKSVYEQINNYAKTYLVYQGFDYLKRSATELINEMVEVEYQMNSIDRVLGDTSLDIDNYRDQLINLASDYGNAFDNVADITLRLAQAGFNAQQSLALTEKTLLALNTAELDATQATDDMVAIMSQWGLMTGDSTEVAKEYGDIIDKINKVADQFPTSSADILDALKRTSSAFNLAGASIDETIAMITTAEIASQRGGKAIGTAMSNIIQQLKAEGRLNIMKDLGIELYTDEAQTEFNSVIDIITQLSEKMQQLKESGQENSVEMQSLLEVFTVFRRNIGAGLLSGVAGEESTYNEVLTTSLNSVGYSLQENSKYMQTAKAAQAQFNAELLRLKTEVWDGGLEDVFRGLLQFGTDLVGGIRSLVDNIGLLPTAIGAVTLALTLLNKSTQASTYTDAIPRIKQIRELYQQTAGQIEGNVQAQKKYNDIMKGADVNFKSYVKTVGNGNVSMGGYVKSLVSATAKTVAMTAATVALQAAISAGVTLAITALVFVIDNLINAEEKAREQALENMQTAQNNATEINQEISSIQELRKEYEELAKKEERTPEENNRIYELQEQINQLLKDSNTQVELITTETNKQGEAVQKVNDKYDEQLEKIKAVEYQKKQNEVEELRRAAEEAQNAMTGLVPKDIFDDSWFSFFEAQDLGKVFKDAGIIEAGKDYSIEINNLLSNLYDIAPIDQINTLNDWITKLKQSSNQSEETTEAIKKLEDALAVLDSQYSTAKDAINEYNNALSELYNMSGQVSQYNTFLESIAESYEGLEGPNKLIDDIQNLNTQFEDGEIEVDDYFNTLQEKIDSIDLSKTGEELEAYQAIFAATTSYIAEGLENLYSGFASNEINFTDFTEGIQEAADATLDLYTKQNELTYDAQQGWINAEGQLNEYANTLQSAKDELSSYGTLLETIGKHYDYIAENANSAGQAIFDQADTSSKAYKSLATDLTNTFNTLRDDNKAAFKSITQNIADNIGISTNEMLDASGYLNQGFLNNFSNMNSALNTVANMSAEATRKVTVSLGNVMSSLGEAISKFSYTLKATPFISGGFGLHTDEKGIPNGISLPTFGFDITGEGGDSVKKLGGALKNFGADLGNLGNINYGYYQLKQQSPYKSSIGTGGSGGYGGRGSGGGGSSGGSGGSGGGGGSGSSRSSRQDDAERKAEERYQKKLDKYKDYINDLEEEEQRWVDKQQELGQLSSEDMQYVTQKRIQRYQKYLDQVKKMTWLNKEDRLELEKEYTQEIEDLQLEYMGYLKDALDEEIDAIQEANDKKIEAIEEEADKQIEALKKVEDERDRSRDKEDYEKQRKEILEEIAYWEQRTGREAQENLKEAKENLEELDEEWEDQLEDWSIEDQIAAIEEQRDAQIAAIEKAEEEEIAALQKIYDEKVKLFSETGKIIYDNSVIQSKKLYQAYKKNFVDPINSELSKLYKSTSSKKSSSSSKKYETYKVKYGDTLSGIAAKFDTTVSKIMAANPSIKNKNLIYAGSNLKIPKFHEGGIVGGNKEGYALLKPNEVILKTEWAASLNRMMKYFDNLTTGNATNITNGPTIEVSGNLVNIDANIKNKSDVDLLTRKIEKVLTDKFNIKK